MKKNLKYYFYKGKRGHIWVFWETFFSPNLQEKLLSAYTEYARNDRSLSIIGTTEIFPEYSN